jgi:hypothetical protein
MPIHAHTKQYSILSGEMYFEPLVGGIYMGERYLGNAPSAELSIEAQKLDHYDADTNEVSKDFSFATRVDRRMTLTLDEMSVENLSLFFSTDSATVSQTAGSVTDEAIDNVQPGRYYQIGVSPTNLTGVRAISAVTVKVGTSTKVINTDYLLDLARGRVYIQPGGTITAGSTILVSYTRPANTRTRLTTGSAVTAEGRMRFIANNISGTNRDYYFPSVSITPSGSFQFKGGGENPTVGTLALSVEILKPANAPAILIDGLPA